MKILQVADYYDSSTGNPLAVISKKLAEKGHSITVLASNIAEKGKFEDAEKFKIIRCWGFKLGTKAIIPALKARLFFRTEKIFHSHVLGFYSTFVVSVLKKFKNFRFFLTPDFDVKSERPKGLKKIYYRWFFRFPLKTADVVLPFTEMEKLELHERFNVPLEKMIVLPIGIDFEKFQQAPKTNWRKKLALGKKFVILSLCFLHEKKNIELALEALAELKKRKKDFVFVHCGGVMHQKYMDKINFLVKKLDLEENVVFLGKKNLEEAIDVYKAGDVFLQTGFRESYCIPVLEAMAAGLPVVSTKVGIAEDIVVGGKTGFIAENAKEIAQKLAELTDENLREKMQKNCIEMAKKFDWNGIIGKLEKIYSGGKKIQ